MNRLNLKGGGADRRRRGFTLIEITVAMGLLAVIMLGLAATAGISTRGGAMSRQRTRATYLASQMLETLCAGNIADITPFNGDDTSLAIPNYPVGEETDLWGQRIRQQLGDGASGTIGVVGNGADPTVPPGKLRITVTVAWPLFGQDHRVQMVGVR